MKTLFINAKVVDPKNLKIFNGDVLISNGKIIKVDKNINQKVDKVIDLKGKWICPGFIDGHIHIESSKLLPNQLAKLLVRHGTTAIVSDPHEIANVAGTKGIDFMIQATKNLPIDVYLTIPSCVPATGFDESYETLSANKIKRFANLKQVVGLSEVMDYVSVVNHSKAMIEKIKLFQKINKKIDGHAPELTGELLKTYVRAGIQSDHECITCPEAIEKINLGQQIMIRYGSAVNNLKDLLPLIDKYYDKCMMVTDDAEPLDLLTYGHLDKDIKIAIDNGKPLLKAIAMVTYNTARYFNLDKVGLILPDYKANFIIFDDLNKLSIKQVYHNGQCVYNVNKNISFKSTTIDKNKYPSIYHSINIKPLKISDLKVNVKGKHITNVIDVVPKQLVTKQLKKCLDFDVNNGIDVDNDILKIVVVERHKATGHIGLGYIHGFKFKNGALASTVSHDSHNIIAIGTNDKDILLAINRIKAINGGNVVVSNHKVIGELSLPIAGLISDKDAATFIKQSKKIEKALKQLKVNKLLSPFMNMAFISLPVIPDIKITTKGLVDVKQFKLIDLVEK